MPEQDMPTVVQWAPVAAAVATFLAVLVALFRESFFLWWRRPCLNVTIKAEPPDCNKTQVRLQSGTTFASYYFRLWVTNAGRTTANRVQVFAQKLLRKNADGTFQNEPRFLPMNLLWSHTGVVFTERIAPKMGHHCDLGHIFPPNATDPNILRPPRITAGKTCFELETEVRPFTGSSHLEPGTYRLELRAAAENAEPRDIVVEICLPGEWYDDEGEMLSRGIGLRVV